MESIVLLMGMDKISILKVMNIILFFSKELATDSLYNVLHKISPNVERSINWATQIAQGFT